ncbi:hypothetical protein, partial [Paenibacillus thiaminolyticus]|uniref:hypothetical protein n=1 Tax=Paenibacillus thiaminolyticus TaxID=49283 RepID=UPI001C725B80
LLVLARGRWCGGCLLVLAGAKVTLGIQWYTLAPVPLHILACDASYSCFPAKNTVKVQLFHGGSYWRKVILQICTNFTP